MEHEMARDERMENEPEAPEAPVTVADLDALCAEIFDQKRKIDDIKADLTGENKKLMELKFKCVKYLKELDRTSYKAPQGNIHIRQNWRVNMPVTDVDKQALFDWMRSEGIYDKYATVNAAALNALYMAEWEAAKEAGKGMEFAIPGVGDPKLFEDLGMRK